MNCSMVLVLDVDRFYGVEIRFGNVERKHFNLFENFLL